MRELLGMGEVVRVPSLHRGAVHQGSVSVGYSTGTCSRRSLTVSHRSPEFPKGHCHPLWEPLGLDPLKESGPGEATSLLPEGAALTAAPTKLEKHSHFTWVRRETLQLPQKAVWQFLEKKRNKTSKSIT